MHKNYQMICKINQLQIEINKTKVLIIAKKNKIEFNYKIKNKNLETVTEMRLIGVIIDQKLTFSSHINLTISKAQRSLICLMEQSKIFKNPYNFCKLYVSCHSLNRYYVMHQISEILIK